MDDAADPTAPEDFAPGLNAAYPSPCTASAMLTCSLPFAADVRLEVFDTLGRRVTVLEDVPRAAGSHTATLRGAGLGSGTYFVRLTAGTRTATITVTLVR